MLEAKQITQVIGTFVSSGAQPQLHHGPPQHLRDKVKRAMSAGESLEAKEWATEVKVRARDAQEAGGIDLCRSVSVDDGACKGDLCQPLHEVQGRLT